MSPAQSRSLTLLAGVAVGTLVLAGCSSATSAVDEAGITIVASTIVYGDIAETIAGDAATVTSIITSPAQDPHSYEASAQDQLALSKADIVIENGGGYDTFIDTLLDASGSNAVVLNASETSGLIPTGEGDAAEESPAEAEAAHDHIEGFNEHVWYEPHAMEALAEALVAELSAIAPESAPEFETNYAAFVEGLEGVESLAESLHERLDGSGVAVTEPVAIYLLAEAGLDNVTPEAFTEAIEEGADVSPTALAETLELIESGQVVLLAYNTQTASPETERIAAAATAAGIPIVEFAETLPDGQDYVSWMTANLEAIAAALPA